MAKNKGQPRVTVNPWLIAVTVSLATFMEVMDTSIANVALRHIAGSVAASQDESTWVLTSYLVSNAIVVPISGWLASVLGRKRFYMGCVALFTLSSFLCGVAPNLSLLLFFRVLQGIGGGGLAPSEQAILNDTFSESQRGLAFALYGVAVVVAPAIGPALGGWITDSFSWRWIFFINIPVGILSLILTGMLVQDSPAAIKEHQRAVKGGVRVDYIGFILVAIGLGCLQVVLDKGQEDDWFGSNFITLFTMLSLFGILGAIFWEGFISKNPIVDLSLFKNVGFFFVCVMMFAVLFVLQSTTQLLPQFVQQISHYNATKAGLVLMPGGFAIMALMPVAGILVRKIQPKYLISFGFILTGLAMAHLTGFNTLVSFNAVAIARVYQGIGLAFLFVPINTLAYNGLPKSKSNSASAMINLMRNLGGSVGISVATAMLTRRSQVHQAYLTRWLTPTDRYFQHAISSAGKLFAAHGAGPIASRQQGLATFMGALQDQTGILAYIDIFQFLIIACAVACFCSFFLKRITPGKASAAA
jgi:DHA2 family multidrug resistance protein